MLHRGWLLCLSFSFGYRLFATIQIEAREHLTRIRQESRNKLKKLNSLESVGPEAPAELGPMSPGDAYYAKWQSLYPNPEKIGIGIVGSNNGEAVFTNNTLRAAKGFQQLEVKDGVDLLKVFQRYTQSNQCIPKILFAGHGWTQEMKEGGPGLPLASSYSGLYQDRQSLKSIGRSMAKRAATLTELRGKILKKEIRFCDPCLIQIHSCNIDPAFAEALSDITRCQVITGRGQVSPVDTPDGKADHIWLCTAGFNRTTPLGKPYREYIGQDFIAD